MPDKNIAIFASGSGSNAEKIIQYFEDAPDINVVLVLTNNPNAGVLERASKHKIPIKIFNRKEFYETSEVVNTLKEARVDLIVLAGFLWLLPKSLIDNFPSKIINIHPALLPKYGGKGMYGMNVHKAIIESKEKESGITIHYIDENYDEGEIILQEKCIISEDDTAEDLAKKIQVLEHEYFPKAIGKILRQEI